MRKLLVCDLDNTLYDWVGYFVPSFYAMVDEPTRILMCDRETLLDDFKKVHQAHGDSEHPFALLETQTVASRFPGKGRRELAEIFDTAFHAFNIERKNRLRLYDGVTETLEQLSRQDVAIVAHTEGKLYSVIDRLRRLNLLHTFSKIYCRERSSVSHVRPEVGSRWIGDFPMGKVTELSGHQRKPNPSVLREICECEGVSIEASTYVGDSVSRDVMMAKSVGVLAVWAKYGTHVAPDDYAGLVRVTDWTPADVERESELRTKSANIVPDVILERSFDQILDIF